MKRLFQNLLPEGTEEIREKLQSQYWISWSTIEPWTSLFRSDCANHSVATFRSKLHTIRYLSVTDIRMKRKADDWIGSVVIACSVLFSFNEMLLWASRYRPIDDIFRVKINLLNFGSLSLVRALSMWNYHIAIKYLVDLRTFQFSLCN
jgi:hypothetical protein